MTQVNFEFLDSAGSPREAVEFVIMLKRPGFIEAEDGVILPEVFTTITDVDGKFTLEMAPSSTPYQITMVDPAADPNYPCKNRVTYKFYVPDVATPVRAQDLFIAVPPTNLPWDEEAIARLNQAVIEATGASEAANTAAMAAAAAAAEAQETADQLGDITNLFIEVAEHDLQITDLETSMASVTSLVATQGEDISALDLRVGVTEDEIDLVKLQREYKLVAGNNIIIDRTNPLVPVVIGEAASWGEISGTLSAQTDLQNAFNSKVDKVVGKQLTDVNFSTADKARLDATPTNHDKGYFTSEAALIAAWPTATQGDYAFVDAGIGLPVTMWLWDTSDAAWTTNSSPGSMTPTQIKTAYESNPDTNAYTDVEKTKLGGIQAGAQVNYVAVSQVDSETGTSTALTSWTAQRVRQAILGWWNGSAEKAKLAGIASGATQNSTDATLLNRANHTGSQTASTISDFAASVRATVLVGFSTSSAAVVVATDTFLDAIGKLQRQVSDVLATLTAHVGAGSSAHALVTTAVNGFMSAVDKVKLNGLIKQTSATDTTAGALMTVGAFGLGGSGLEVSNIDSLSIPQGYWSYGDITTTGVKPTAYGHLHVFVSGTWVAQTAYSTTPCRSFTRVNTNGAGWTAWVQVFTSGNILGTVSQSAGVPTGAIIERGSNANGEYTRWADGTQICRQAQLTVNSVGIARGNVFFTGSDVWHYPAIFATVPSISHSERTGVGLCWTGLGVEGTSAYSTSFSAYSAIGNPSQVSVHLIAIGRWF